MAISKTNEYYKRSLYKTNKGGTVGAKKLALSSIHRVERVQKYGTFFDFSKRRISERYIILKVR